MVDKLKIKRDADTDFERDATASIEEVSRSSGTDPEWIPAATLMLTDKHQGRLLVFTNACVVTVPAGLRDRFTCGWMQAGVGTVSFIPGAGATLNSVAGARRSNAQWSVGGLAAVAPENYVVYGDLVV